MLIRLLNDSIKRWHNREHYDYQQKISTAIIQAVEKSSKGETLEIPIELPRQSGKTTAVVDTTEFLLSSALRYLKKPLRIGIFAPQTEQASTDFDRLKMQFVEIAKLGFTTKTKTEGDLKFPERWNSKAIRIFSRSNKFLGEVYIFPISKTSNPESKTLDLIIVEEAQDVDDEKMKNAIFPMGASTNAPRIYIGTSGRRICYFKRQIENNPNKIKISLDEVFKQRRARADATGDDGHLLYESFVNHEVLEHGKDSDYIKTQYFGVWIIGTGQFTVTEELDALIGKHGLILKTDLPSYAGLDVAKSPDRAVLTVIADHEKDPLKSKLCGWLSMLGENYEDQFELILDFLKQFTNLRGIAIDATGQGDFMPDKFEKHTSYNIERVKFTAERKDVLYKILMQVIKNKITSVPNLPENEDYKRFRQELLDLEKEYKGRFLSVHHPQGKDMHDDYPDSWALAEWMKSHCLQNEPSLSFI